MISRLAPAVLAFGVRVGRRFFAQGMTVFAAALAYRGLVALVPLALLSLSLLSLFGIERALPRITAMLLRLRGLRGEAEAEEVPLEWLLSLGAVIGLWSMSVGARLFMRAMNTAHGVEETRAPLVRGLTSVVFLPGLAAVSVAAAVVLLITSRIVAWIAGWVGLTPFVLFLGSWLRMPTALAVVAGALAAAYRFGPAVRPPWRAVAAGAGIAVVLWTAVSFGFGLAVSTVLDYGATYGSLGAAVALLVYLHLAAVVVLVGAQVSALLAEGSVVPPAGGDGGVAPPSDAGAARAGESGWRRLLE